MAIINITITPSTEESVPGIPIAITLGSNIPATIFYTIDGSTPNTFSPIYIAPILIPQSLLNLTISIFATNGTDSSAIIVQEFVGDKTKISTAVGDRLPHSAVTNINNTAGANSLFPFGSNSPNPVFNYKNPSDAGTTVYDQSKPAIAGGFDGEGNPAAFTNLPISSYEFQQKYSTLTKENEFFPGVGNLPAKTEVIGSQGPVQYTQEQSSTTAKIFNPKALVIYQDVSTEDPTDPVHINRSFISLENQESVRDGNLLYNAALDSPPTMGGFVNSHYNPRTNEMTYYYFDGTVNRWIISKTPYQPGPNNVSALYNMVFSRPSKSGQNTNGFVFNWKFGLYRTLI